MNNYRIKTDINSPTDKYINIKLEQDFDTINILSLNLSQSDIYSTFASDNGVVVGRINSNLVGIPNAKVSLFIPISKVEERGEILTLYPFKTVKDKDNNGKRYNLLSRLKKLNPFSYIKENIYGIGYTPKTPVGSIPDKNELLVNDTWVEVFGEYYKFTTTTNQSGDFMFMNVPIGTYTLHAEFDITDIGKYSTPAPLLQVTNGLSKSKYNDEGSKLLPESDLDRMGNIYSRDVVVNVLPFWGDKQNFEVGITRQDIDFKVKLTPGFIVTGNGFTQGQNSYWGDRVVFRCLFGLSNLCFGINFNSFKKGSSIMSMYIGFTIFGEQFTLINAGDGWNGGDGVGIKFQIPDCRPRFYIDLLNFYENRVNGGEFDLNPLDFKFLGFGSFKYNELNQIDCCDNFPNCGANQDTITGQLNLSDFRTGTINTHVFYYPENTDLSKPCVTTNDVPYLEYLNDEIKLLSPNQYVTFNNKNGIFTHIIGCNRKRVITNELGYEIETNDTTKGVLTEFSGSMLFDIYPLEISSSGGKIHTDRVRIKVPQVINYNLANYLYWNTNYYTFKANELYTVSQFFNVSQKAEKDGFLSNAVSFVANVTSNPLSTPTQLLTENDFLNTNGGADIDFYGKTGTVLLSLYDNTNTNPTIYFNNLSNNPVNKNSPVYNKTTVVGSGIISDYIDSEWVTGSLLFYQYAYKKRRKRQNSNYSNFLIDNALQLFDNKDDLGGGVTNSRGLLRGDTFPTTFTKIGLETVNNNEVVTVKDVLIDLYKNTDLAVNLDNNPNINTIPNKIPTNKFFIKGINKDSDFITDLIKKDII